MMPAFGLGYYDSKACTRYFNSGVGPSSLYMNDDPSTSYMHGHERGRWEHNKYLYYEAPGKVSDPQEYQ